MIGRFLLWYFAVTVVAISFPAMPGAADAKPPTRGVAFLASEIGNDYSPEELAKFVRDGKFSPVVVDWAWITYHWDKTNFAAVNKFLDLLAADKVPFAAMYRPRFLSNPTVATQVGADGKPGVDHAEICYSDPDARKWGISWGEKIIEKCPAFREIIIYNPTNSCKCAKCTEAAKTGKHSAVVGFLTEAKTAFAAKQQLIRLGVVSMPEMDFWRAAIEITDVAHPFLCIRNNVDPADEVKKIKSVQPVLRDKMGACLGKIEWEEGARVTIQKLKNVDMLASQAGISYFFWTYDALFKSPLYDPKEVAQALGINGSDSESARLTEAERKTGQEALDPVFTALTGAPKMEAIDALVESLKTAGRDTRRAVLMSAVETMRDKSKDPYLRWPCCYLIGRSGYDPGLQPLIDVLLTDKDETVREIAAEALGDWKGDDKTAAHEGLKKAALQERTPAVRDMMAQYLHSEMPALQMSSTKPETEAAPVANETQRNAALAALQAMWDAGPGAEKFKAIDALVKKLAQFDEATRNTILSIAVHAMSDKNRDIPSRWPCCYVISGAGYQKGLQPLIELMMTDDVEIMRQVAAEALGSWKGGSTAAREGLRQAARREKSQQVRDTMAKYLGSDMPPLESSPSSASSSTTPLPVLTEDQRKAAQAVLDEMWKAAGGPPKFAAIDAVVRKATSSDPAMKTAILTVVREAIRDKNRDPFSRWPCCYVISGAAYEPGLPDLVQVLLTDDIEIVRAVAAEALGSWKNSPAARDALKQAARKETSQQVRDTIAKYLGAEMPALDPGAAASAGSPPGKPRSDGGVPELAPAGPPKPPPGPKKPVAKALPWPFPGECKDQSIFNNYQTATDDYIHCGLDFIHPAGTPVKAVGAGYVAAIQPSVNHTHDYFIVTPVKGGSRGWCYTHMDPTTFTFKEGDEIKQGQVLGKLVKFSVNGKPGMDHLHLHYVSFTKDTDGVNIHSVLDPLYFFDWTDDQPPAMLPLWFVAEGTKAPFAGDSSGIVTVNGKVDIIAAITDDTFAGQQAFLGVPVVMLSISDGKHTIQKLVLDQRGDVGDERKVKPLYFSRDETKNFLHQGAFFPFYHVMRVTKTDGDGKISASDSGYCWDTTASGSDGDPAWPDGVYNVNVYAWDLAGNMGVMGAKVRVRNKQAVD